ncbi:hypothetical protein NQ318_000409 [Aromia moschata]|uniref:Translation machinery-associated protein 16 n=1 Tax=Aromia moschata TaxID=1265417 RepID=A0AAV8YVK4_9CUCU|nr:hypothetical protein NQ318_000409 [Aromia moschata]
MPKVKQIEKCKHPNSRKTKALIKQIKRQNNREKIKLSGNIKLNLLGEKVIWFRDHLDPSWTICTPQQVDESIENYLGRFNDELEQIRIKHSVGNRKNRQHANREDIINLTIKREKEEYQTCGLEMPNLLDSTQFKLLKSWNGELRFLQNFKLQRFNKKDLDKEVIKSSKISLNMRTVEGNQKVVKNDHMDVESKE